MRFLISFFGPLIRNGLAEKSTPTSQAVNEPIENNNNIDNIMDSPNPAKSTNGNGTAEAGELRRKVAFSGTSTNEIVPLFKIFFFFCVVIYSAIPLRRRTISPKSFS